jgi:hypothetical protein
MNTQHLVLRSLGALGLATLFVVSTLGADPAVTGVLSHNTIIANPDFGWFVETGSSAPIK